MYFWGARLMVQAGTAPDYKTFRQVKEQRSGSIHFPQCETKKYPELLHRRHLPHHETSKQLFSMKLDWLELIWSNPVCNISHLLNQIAPIASHCTRETADQLAAWHRTWVVGGSNWRVTFGLQNIASESGGSPKHNLLNNFGHSCFRSYTLTPNSRFDCLFGLKSSRLNSHGKCNFKLFSFCNSPIIQPRFFIRWIKPGIFEMDSFGKWLVYVYQVYH